MHELFPHLKTVPSGEGHLQRDAPATAAEQVAEGVADVQEDLHAQHLGRDCARRARAGRIQVHANTFQAEYFGERRDAKSRESSDTK